MPPKRPSPIEDPPAASSSSEGEEDEEEDQEGEEEEEDDDEEGEEDEEQAKAKHPPAVDKKPSVKKPPAKPVAPPTPSAGSGPDAQSSDNEDDEESGSESGSDSEPSPEKLARPSRSADPSIKPLSSKPMDEGKSKKPPAKPSAALPAPAASAPQARTTTPVKRLAESDKDGSKDSKRRKKKAVDEEEDAGVSEDAEKKPGDDKKKQLFQRLWTEDDEIAILKGMLDYYSKKGTDPSADMNAFHDFIKKSLHVDVSRSQLSDKIRRLRKKYMNNAGKGKEGEDPVFSKPHEHKAFELSKKIWGSDAANDFVSDQTVANGKLGMSRKPKNSVGSLQSKVSQLSSEASKVATKSEEEMDWSMYPHLAESFQAQKELWIMNMPRTGDSFVKEGACLVGSSKLNELEQKWRKLRMEEIDLFFKRMELMQEQVKLLQDAWNSKK